MGKIYVACLNLLHIMHMLNLNVQQNYYYYYYDLHTYMLTGKGSKPSPSKQNTLNQSIIDVDLMLG